MGKQDTKMVLLSLPTGTAVQRRFLIASVAIALLAFSIYPKIDPAAFAQALKGPNVDTIKFIEYSDENIALEEL
ncbi:MAG: hypothetical protein ACREA4_08040, partial [Nitrososphaera sp.]